MKTLLIAVAVLLTANLGWMIFGPAGGKSRSVTQVESSSTASVAPSTPALSIQQKALLESGDVNELVGAGFSEEVARQLIAGRAYVLMRGKMDALRGHAPGSGTDYWKEDLNFYSPANLQQRSQVMSTQNEYAETLRRLFGDDSAAFGGGDPRLNFLPKEKREILRRIEQDYREMQAELYGEFASFSLPADREKLALLEKEKQRDILAALTPKEAEEFELRSSQTANDIRNIYGEAIQSEADYRKIFALQKAFDDQYHMQKFYASGNVTQQATEARALAERKMHADIKEALGADVYASMIRASDNDYQALSGLEKRLQLPAGTAEAVYEKRDVYATQSRAISENHSLSPSARREQLAALAQQATIDLQANLGRQGAELYAQRSNWINILKSGSALSSNPNDAPPGMFIQGTTVFPVFIKPAQE